MLVLKWNQSSKRGPGQQQLQVGGMWIVWDSITERNSIWYLAQSQQNRSFAKDNSFILNDVTWASGHLKSPTTHLLVQQFEREYQSSASLAPCDRWIYLTKGQWCRRHFYRTMTSSCTLRALVTYNVYCDNYAVSVRTCLPHCSVNPHAIQNPP